MFDKVNNPSKYKGTGNDTYGGIIKLFKSPNLMGGDWSTEEEKDSIYCFFKVPDMLRKVGSNRFEYNSIWSYKESGVGYKDTVEGIPVPKRTDRFWRLNKNLRKYRLSLKTDQYLRLPYCKTTDDDSPSWRATLLYFYPITEL